jgi:hypothetical protein
VFNGGSYSLGPEQLGECWRLESSQLLLPCVVMCI